MVKKIIFFMAFLLAISLVSAVNTEIKVKTLPAHKVSIFILASDEVYNLLESFHKTSDIYGDVSVTYSSEIDSFDVRVIVKTKEGEKLFNEKFDGYNAGELISIRIDNEEITREYKPVEDVNESVGNETGGGENATSEGEEDVVGTSESIIEEGSSDSGAITGEVVSDNGGVSKIIYVVMLVIVVLIFVLFLLGRKMVSNRKMAKYGSSGDISDTVKTGVGVLKPLNKADESRGLKQLNKSEGIDRLEAKIKDMEREINKLRNQEKILEVQKKLEEDRQELERLQRGY